MRLWSLHPRYLDRQGLLALWREGLLAQKVLAGRTKGYRSHPQLLRFKEHADPMAAIGTYLHHVAEEAARREYRFDRSKILKIRQQLDPIKVSRGQLKYEAAHLLGKLKVRDPKLYEKHSKTKALRAHPFFRPVFGGIESWERPN
jgi:hypothetical protein